MRVVEPLEDGKDEKINFLKIFKYITKVFREIEVGKVLTFSIDGKGFSKSKNIFGSISAEIKSV